MSFVIFLLNYEQIFKLKTSLTVVLSQKIMTYLFDFPHGPKVNKFLLTQFEVSRKLEDIFIFLCLSRLPLSLAPPTGPGSPTSI